MKANPSRGGPSSNTPVCAPARTEILRSLTWAEGREEDSPGWGMKDAIDPGMRDWVVVGFFETGDGL